MEMERGPAPLGGMRARSRSPGSRRPSLFEGSVDQWTTIWVGASIITFGEPWEEMSSA